MPDEPLEVQLARIEAEKDARRWATWEKLGLAFIAVVASIPALFAARYAYLADQKAEAQAAQIRWMQQQQYETRLDMRAIEEDRAGGPWIGKAPPPPPPKE